MKGRTPPALLYATACVVILWACAMVARLNLETMGVLR